MSISQEYDLKAKSSELKVKAITKSLQKIDHPPIREFIVIVEGKDDIPFYLPVFNDSLWKIVPLCGIKNVKFIFQKKAPKKHDNSKEMKEVLKGENNQEKINQLVKMRDENKVIGIIDLDFEKEKNIKNLYLPDDYYNLFVTETNDVQTFLLFYGELKKIFIEKLCDQGKIFKFKVGHGIQDLSSQMIAMASFSGLARHLNKKLNKSVNFKSLRPDDVFFNYLKKNKSLTSDDICKLLREDPESHFDSDFESQYKCELSSIDVNFPNRWDICQGHDMMRILLSIHHVMGCKGNFRKEEPLLEVLCSLFHDDKRKLFSKTELYRALKLWKEGNFPYTDIELFSEKYGPG